MNGESHRLMKKVPRLQKPIDVGLQAVDDTQNPKSPIISGDMAIARLPGASQVSDLCIAEAGCSLFARVPRHDGCAQLDNLWLWSNPALLWSCYVVAMGLQLLALYTSLPYLFGVEPLDWMDMLTSR